MSNKPKSIIKDGLYTLSSNYFAQTCNIVRGFYSANILGPAGYGLWSIIQFYMEFGKFAPLGMDEASAREMTQNILKGKSKDSFHIIRIYTIYAILLSILTLICGLLVLSIFGNKDNPVQYYGIIFVTGSLIACQMDRFAYTILSSYGKFSHTSLMKGIYAVVSLVIVIIFVDRLKIFAMYWSYFLGTFIPPLVILLIYLRHIIKNHPSIKTSRSDHPKYTKQLFRSSISLLGVSILNTALANLDRFFVASTYSKYDNGIYFLAGNIAMSLNLAIFSFTVVIYQRMNLLYGEHNDKKKTFEYIINACKKAAIYFPYVIIFAYYIIPCVFVLLFKEYVPSTFFLRCFVFAGYFYSIFMLLNYELVAIKKQKLLNIIYSSIILIGSLVYFVSTKNLQIYYIPYLVIALNIILMLSNLYLSRKISGGIYKKRRLMINLLSTPVFLFLVMQFLDRYIPDASLTSYLLKAGISLASYYLFHRLIEKLELKSPAH